MFIKFIIYLTGIILVATSIVFIIIYFNLLNMGYSFLEYVNFIIRRVECINLIIGIIILLLLHRKGKRNDLYL